MKTRIKIKETHGGQKLYFPQHGTELFPFVTVWDNIWEDDGDMSATNHTTDIQMAKNTIDKFLESQAEKERNKIKSVTYLKYP